MTDPLDPNAAPAGNFIEQIIRDDLATGRVQSVVTRFPPEPNGYLHIGHAKSICLNFGLAEQFNGQCNLRFDDTNPEKESQEYVDAIIADVKWLGFQWAGEVRYASDYFGQLYQWAQYLVDNGLAYVCELNAEEMRDYRGTLTEPGRPSPYRERPPSESRQLLEAMRCGDIDEGKMTLRAKIDMASPNINMRDPVLYRVRKVAHHRTGSDWNIYPNYDFAHGQEDAIEGVSHSVCTLEFAANRPLYNWFVENLPLPSQPRQYEFGRLNLTHTMTSKRKLKRLVDERVVDGWDDPRMPTISGLRRRGVTANAIREFCNSLAVAKTDGVVDIAQFEHFIRDDLNTHAPRAMCVIEPLKVVLTNCTGSEELTAANHPNRPELGERVLPFDSELFIDRSDFSEDTTLSRKKFKRLVLGEYVRLRGAYIIRADEVVRDNDGTISQLNCSLVEGTVGADGPEGVRPRGVIHWVSAPRSQPAELRLYERLFTNPNVEEGDVDLFEQINPASLTVVNDARVEQSLAAAPQQTYQFEREGYFVREPSAADRLVFNLTIGLRDSGRGQGK